MTKEDMLEQIIQELKALPDRKSLKHDDDILKNYKFTNEIEIDNKIELDSFKREIPPSTIKY